MINPKHQQAVMGSKNVNKFCKQTARTFGM